MFVLQNLMFQINISVASESSSLQSDDMLSSAETGSRGKVSMITCLRAR